MSERTSAYQKAQCGIESSLGGAATIDKQLVSIGIKAAPKIITSPYTPQGSLLPTIVPIGKDYTEASYECSPIYEEIGLIFGSLFSKPTTGIYAIDGTSPNTPNSYKFQIGDGTNCEGFSGAVFNSIDLKWTRDKLDVSGNILGRSMDTATWAVGAAPPATVTPILPKKVSVKVDDVKLTRCLSVEFSMSDRWKDLWVLDAAQNSYVKLVETPLKANVKLLLVANAEGKAFIDSVRGNNATQVITIEAASDTKSFELKAATKVAAIDEFGDEEGVYAVGVDLAVVYDAVLDLAIEATVDTV